jgi:hypothetical protein
VKAKRSNRTEEELQKASDHLHYEIWMFQALAQAMALGIAGRGNVINSSFLESFTIHVRVLIGFFYSDDPRDDDIIADDFFTSPGEWQKIRPPKTDLLYKAKKRADKEVAHLTYTRLAIAPEQKQWDFVKIFNDLQELIEIFLKSVPANLLGSKWEDIKKQRAGHHD